MFQLDLSYLVYPPQGQPYPVEVDRWITRAETEEQALCGSLENATLVARSKHGWRTMIELVQVNAARLVLCPACEGRRSTASLEGVTPCPHCCGRGYIG